MGKASDKNGKKGGGNGLDSEDIRLWAAFTRDIEPLEGRSADPAETAPPPAPAKPKAEPRGMSYAVPAGIAKSPQAPQLDARTEQRLRRGRMPIEGTLDLHGHTQERAHSALLQFVMAAQGSGKRCVLVITGKGRGGQGEGILKRKLPDWISDAPLRDVILKTVPASPRHGGGGAWYLYLKRQRDYT